MYNDEYIYEKSEKVKFGKNEKMNENVQTGVYACDMCI